MPVTDQDIKDKRVAMAAKNVEVVQATNALKVKRNQLEVLQGELSELLAQKALEDLSETP